MRTTEMRRVRTWDELVLEHELDTSHRFWEALSVWLIERHARIEMRPIFDPFLIPDGLDPAAKAWVARVECRWVVHAVSAQTLREAVHGVCRSVDAALAERFVEAVSLRT